MQKHSLQITLSPKLLNDHDTHTFGISYIPVLINVNINSSGSCGGNNITPGTQAVRLKKKKKSPLMTESCIKQNRGFKKALLRSVPIAGAVGKEYKEISCVIHQGIN